MPCVPSPGGGLSSKAVVKLLEGESSPRHLGRLSASVGRGWAGPLQGRLRLGLLCLWAREHLRRAFVPRRGPQTHWLRGLLGAPIRLPTPVPGGTPSEAGPLEAPWAGLRVSACQPACWVKSSQPLAWLSGPCWALGHVASTPGGSAGLFKGSGRKCD